ncbi:MAG: chemotaxis protein CheA [Spirochaetales bacterium]|nr:chemotaxis protein CheA [Spirochaetales bacterium]
MNFDRGLIKEFVTETKEHLESLQTDLLALESQKEKPHKELIDNIFRVIHTIKGNAGFFQLINIGELSHVMEAILSRVRTGKIIPDSDIVDILLGGIDLVDELINDIEQSDIKDISGKIAVLNRILHDTQVPDSKHIKESPVTLVDNLGNTLHQQIDRQVLDMIPRHHDYLYCIKYDLKVLLDEKKITPVTLINKLIKTGNILLAKVNTPFKDLHEGLPVEMQYCILYSTVLDPDIIADAVCASPDKIQQVDLKKLQSRISENDLITDELVNKFISETTDFLDKIENYILEIEGSPGNTEAVGEAFRLIHSIKGNAGFFNYSEIEQQTMRIESILSEIRENKATITASTISTLLNLLDTIKRFVNSISDKTKDPDESRGKHKLLGKILVDMGVISEDVLEVALKKQDRKLGEILIDENHVSEEAVNRAIDLQHKEGGNENVNYSYYAVKKWDIRVDMEKLDSLFNLMGELVTAEAMVINHPDLKKIEMPGFVSSASYLSKITREMQEIILSVRMVPLEGLFNKMRRLVRDLSAQFHKQINFIISGQETEMDRSILEMLSDPLIHLIRNSIDHGIEDSQRRIMQGKSEEGVIHLDAKYEGNEIWITIEDDGAGLCREKIIQRALRMGLLTEDNTGIPDHEVWQLIFKPGFSTAEKVSKISGRGVGLDVVKRNIDKLRGKISVSGKEGEGTSIVLKIPLTLAIIDGVVVKVGNLTLAIPINDISEFHKAADSQITVTDGKKEVLKLRERIIPIINLSTYFKVSPAFHSTAEGIIVISGDSDRNYAGFLVDEILSFQQIVIKALPDYLDTMRGVSGCTISNGGEVNLIIDTHTIITDMLLHGHQ